MDGDTVTLPAATITNTMTPEITTVTDTLTPKITTVTEVSDPELITIVETLTPDVDTITKTVTRITTKLPPTPTTWTDLSTGYITYAGSMSVLTGPLCGPTGHFLNPNDFRDGSMIIRRNGYRRYNMHIAYENSGKLEAPGVYDDTDPDEPLWTFRFTLNQKEATGDCNFTESHQFNFGQNNKLAVEV
ncbi:hypothetical protein ABW19_dt0200101 [Dactylella cylindrospora]|nr:hypothetical protein ABW19_dt0200101 [Dactylella cylindrospora]